MVKKKTAWQYQWTKTPDKLTDEELLFELFKCKTTEPNDKKLEDLTKEINKRNQN